MSDATLLMEREEAIATVTLNRPKVLNALDRQLFNELEQAFSDLADDPTVRVVLLTGAGEKSFAAGADIPELAQTDPESGQRLALRGQAVLQRIERCGKPVIALINGFALGAGCELAMACTLRVAAETAKLGQPEVKLGLIPGYGGTQRLPRLVGSGAALRLLVTGEMVTATEALRLGLVDEVVPPAQLRMRGRALASEIAALAPLAVSACIHAVQRGAALELDHALRVEAQLFGELSGTADKHEGIAAFLEKRRPVFQGR